MSEPTHPEHENMRLWGPNSSIPASSTGRRWRPPTTHSPEFGSRARASRDQDRRKRPSKGRRATLTPTARSTGSPRWLATFPAKTPLFVYRRDPARVEDNGWIR
ncbi:hypothetical protein P0R27_34535 [Bradyrhizobium yuanmingense]|nr:hypothetical protein [Bradyrhizobium yuanmingense]MDF0498421.1 hypothetical protein [Bradyrhizobium yuanmingense]